MLDSIIAAQKEKNPSANISKSSLEDTLANVDTMSAADFKKLLAGESIQTAATAPASNVIDIAQDIKKLSENSDTQVVAESKTIEIIENTNNNIEQMSSNIDKLNDIQEDISLTPEEKAEQIALIRDEIDVLKQIEANTRGTSIVPKSSYGTGDDKQSTMMPGLMGFLGGGLAGGISGLFAGIGTGASGSGILAALTGGITKFISKLFIGLLKGAVIFTIIGSLANGLVDALEEYKKSGDLVEAFWAGMGGVLEFLSLGFFDKEDLDKLREEVNSYWESFSNALTDFLDSITPDFLKDKVTDKGTSAGLITRMTADEGQLLSTIEHKDPKTGEVAISGKEIKQKWGDNQFSVQVDGQEYRVSKKTYNAAKDLLDAGKTGQAKWLLKRHAEKENAEIQKTEASRAPKISLQEINKHTSSLDDSAVMLAPERTTADNVIRQTESNTALKEAIAGTPAPVIVNAPTNNTSMQHTTALPNIKARNNDVPNLINSYSFP